MSDLSEKEQLEELRVWWQENRAWLLGGVILVIAALVGTNQWRAWQENRATEASAQYEALARQVSENNLDAAAALASELFETYDDTPYGAQARLAMARLYMDRGRDGDAAAVLRPLAAGGDGPMQQIARLRLARILLYQDQASEVPALLGEPGESAFAARFFAVLGDAHRALGNHAAAAEAYRAALADPHAQQTIDTALVQMKLDDLPETQTGPAAVPADDPGNDGDETADDAGAGE